MSGAASKPVVYLTGASGFTGRHFRDEAVQRGYRVVCSNADVRDYKVVLQEIAYARPDYVVHLAAVANDHCDDWDLLHAVNVAGTGNVLQALVDAGTQPKRVLVASSVLVYGRTPTTPVKETDKLHPGSLYAKSKVEMEQLALSYADRIPVTIVRPFNYTGPGQPGKFLIPKLVDHFRHRKPCVELGNLDVEREINDVRMVCDVYLRLLQADTAGAAVFNVCSGKPMRLRSVVDTFGTITGHNIEIRVNPAFLRSNEVMLLCGDTSRLETAIGKLDEKYMSLDRLLRWMLQCE
jgi:nucleoside-diphosphate-sugar epimerase